LGSQNRTQSWREMETAFVQGGALTPAPNPVSRMDRRQSVTSFNDRLAEPIADRLPNFCDVTR
jgi:hypothetical protein